MNKTAIKNFAIWSRVTLIEAVKQKAFEYEITGQGGEKTAVSVGGRLLTEAEQKQRAALISQIAYKGFEQVMEEAAYTWFNRFIALRYMEVNNFLPLKIRLFSDENDEFNPEILKEAMNVELEGIDKEKIYNFIEAQDNESLYRYLIIAQCNALGECLPGMFEKIEDYTELLFPNNLLKPGSVLDKMVTEIPTEDWEDAVQIIGWMYQYYNTELNEKVYDGSFSKNKIPKDLLPAATTIYTPDWAVRYMVENSLGRLFIVDSGKWLVDSMAEAERAAKEKEVADSFGWKYYLPEAEQEPEVRAQLITNHQSLTTNFDVTNIKVIDPCMGSGHILVYAFDVLMQMYSECGWSERDAAKSILENNLYGLDIDDRAGQLAYFAVMMKARKYNRRILNGETKPNVMAIQESNNFNPDYLSLFGELKDKALSLLENMKDAKELGSIIQIKLTVEDLSALKEKAEEIKNNYYDNFFDTARQTGIVADYIPFINQAIILAQKYDTVVTNPPYLGNARFSSKLDCFVKEYYIDVKSDLSMIMYKKAVSDFSKQNGYVSFITTSSWMILSSFEKLRVFQSSNSFIQSLVDFGTELFDGKVGHNPIVAWVTCCNKLDYIMTAIRLVDYCYSRRDEKQKEFFNQNNYYFTQQTNFSKIPGAPIAYWVSERFVNNYNEGVYFESVGHPRTGMQTSNNDKYLRIWHEINTIELFRNDNKWIKYIKGGPFRRWYGNLDYVVFYNRTPDFILQQKNARVLPESELKEEKCTWTDLTSGKFSCRIAPIDSFHDISGHCFYPSIDDMYYLLALSNTCVFQGYLDIINSSMHCQVGDVAKVPVIFNDKKDQASDIAEKNVILSKSDWDSFETSWDFKKHPLI